MKAIMSEMENRVERINARLNIAEEKISKQQQKLSKMNTEGNYYFKKKACQ